MIRHRLITWRRTLNPVRKTPEGPGRCGALPNKAGTQRAARALRRDYSRVEVTSARELRLESILRLRRARALVCGGVSAAQRAIRRELNSSDCAECRRRNGQPSELTPSGHDSEFQLNRARRKNGGQHPIVGRRRSIRPRCPFLPSPTK